MNNLIQTLTVYDVGIPKKRLGRKEDGGYVINELLLNKSKRLITLGYGNEDSFEIDWYEITNTPIDIYDGTCTCRTICDRYQNLLGSVLNYHQQNVGDGGGHIKLEEILRYTTGGLLKVDIEGGEYTAFNDIDLSLQTGVLIEFHNLHESANRNRIISLLSNELKEFVLFHIHANNWTGTFNLDGIQFPQTIEVSLIHQSLIPYKKVDKASYPISELDFPNNNISAEISLPWVNTAL
jgi:hypothetical protein